MSSVFSGEKPTLTFHHNSDDSTQFTATFLNVVCYQFSYLIDKQIMIGKFIGFIYDEDLMTIFEETLEHCLKYGLSIRKRLTDVSEYEGSFDGVNEWVVKTYTPKLLANGFKYLAFILPQDFFAKLSADEYNEQVSRAQLPFTRKFFETAAQGIDWLESCE